MKNTDEILQFLDEEAREYDHYDYGLPLTNEEFNRKAVNIINVETEISCLTGLIQGIRWVNIFLDLSQANQEVVNEEIQKLTTRIEQITQNNSLD